MHLCCATGPAAVMVGEKPEVASGALSRRRLLGGGRRVRLPPLPTPRRRLAGPVAAGAAVPQAVVRGLLKGVPGSASAGDWVQGLLLPLTAAFYFPPPTMQNLSRSRGWVWVWAVSLPSRPNFFPIRMDFGLKKAHDGCCVGQREGSCSGAFGGVGGKRLGCDSCVRAGAGASRQGYPQLGLLARSRGFECWCCACHVNPSPQTPLGHSRVYLSAGKGVRGCGLQPGTFWNQTRCCFAPQRPRALR